MDCIDFDARFMACWEDWEQKNRHRFKRVDDMEDEVPGVYLRFLNTPADWLNGETPADYFEKYDDGKLLVDWMRAYAEQDVPVPDLLLHRITELPQTAAQPLMGLLVDRSAPLDARANAIELLREMELDDPLVTYVRWQVERDEDDDLLEKSLESLKDMGEAALAACRTAFRAADDVGKEALLDYLSDYPATDEVFAFALESFKRQPDKRALFAGYLGKLDDDRALEALLDVAESDDVSYIDFLEIRNAVERLGGEAPVRDFTGDPTYQAMRRMQEK